MFFEKKICTEGIILRRQEYRESSYLCSVLSPDIGLFTLIVSGAKKENSRFHGLFSPFYNLKLQLYRKSSSTFYILIDADFIESFFYEFSFRKLVVQQAAVELLQKVYIEESEQADTYRLFITFLFFLREVNIQEIIIFLRFSFRLFIIIGTPIDLNLQLDVKKMLFYFRPQIKDSVFFDKRSIRLSENTMNILLNLYSLGKNNEKIFVCDRVVRDISIMIQEYLNIVFHTNFSFNSLVMYPL